MVLPQRSGAKSVLLALGWYVHGLHQGVARYAAEANWFLDASASLSKKPPLGWSGDGIITVMWEDSTPLAKYILNLKRPIVNIGSECQVPNVPMVINDNEAIGREMAREFLSNGFNHLAFFCQALNSTVVQQRMTGFRNEVIKAKKKFYLLDFSADLLNPNLSTLIPENLAKKLKSLPKPLAVGTQFDDDANLVSRSALSINLKIPEEIAIIGADNDPIGSRFGPVPLTSIDTNIELQGYKAAELLDEIMSGKKPPSKPIVIPVGSIWRRRSSERMATECPILSKAIRFIDQNFNKNIDISEIVSAIGTSKRSLFLKFEKELGISPKQELLRRRIQHAKFLLLNSTQKIESIANDCGFNKAGAFAKAFQKETGQAPTFFRSKRNP